METKTVLRHLYGWLQVGALGCLVVFSGGALAAAQEEGGSETVRFAVVGDYGVGTEESAAVAYLVASWDVDFVITTGDNNYPDGAASTIDEHIGQLYSDFIAPYYGVYGTGAEENRFFPSLGNHDWHAPDAQPYIDYFTLPGNERYYELQWGPVHLFALDSDRSEPDGIESDSVQAEWLRQALAASTAPWKLVYMHHPPFSSGEHGSYSEMQWPYQEWGATAVLAGHDHLYERILMDGFPYFVNGFGGARLYDFERPVIGSAVRYNDNHGAMLVEADADSIVFRAFSVEGSGTEIDRFTMMAFEPVADSRVEETEPATNFGTQRLRVDGGQDERVDSYLRFEVEGVQTLPDSARLYLFSTTGSDDEVLLYTGSANWTEDTVTWENRPSDNGPIIGKYEPVIEDGWLQFDVSRQLTGDGSYNFVLRSSSSDGVFISSRDSEQPPQLIIGYAGGSGAEAEPTPPGLE